jgi:hypothetical protein
MIGQELQGIGVGRVFNLDEDGSCARGNDECLSGRLQ